jgi:hypothetical protein
MTWTDGQDPATATIETSNFEVVEPASRPVTGTPWNDSLGRSERAWEKRSDSAMAF